MLKLNKIKYSDLNARQKENHNFHKVAAELANYGFNSIWLNDDWMGADFIAYNGDGTTIKIQLKGRLTIDKKYFGAEKNIYVTFCQAGKWYLYPHDEVCEYILSLGRINSTLSWDERGGYSWKSIPPWLITYMQSFCLD